MHVWRCVVTVNCMLGQVRIPSADPLQDAQRTTLQANKAAARHFTLCPTSLPSAAAQALRTGDCDSPHYIIAAARHALHVPGDTRDLPVVLTKHTIKPIQIYFHVCTFSATKLDTQWWKQRTAAKPPCTRCWCQRTALTLTATQSTCTPPITALLLPQ
jgi:hypothetical protein